MATYTTKFSIGDKVILAAEYYGIGDQVCEVRWALVYACSTVVTIKYAVQLPNRRMEEVYERDLTTAALSESLLRTTVTTTVSPHYFQD